MLTLFFSSFYLSYKHFFSISLDVYRHFSKPVIDLVCDVVDLNCDVVDLMCDVVDLKCDVVIVTPFVEFWCRRYIYFSHLFILYWQ